MKSLVVFVAVLLASTAPGVAGTLRVPDDVPTLLEAADLAAAGDTILVSAGVWTDVETRMVSYGGILRSVTSNAFLKPGLTIIGEGGADNTIVQGPGLSGGIQSVLHFVDHPVGELVVEGMTINGPGVGIDAWGSAFSGTRVTVRNCVIRNSSPGIHAEGGDLLVEDCQIVSNENRGVIGASGVGIYAEAVNLEIYRSQFHDNLGTTVFNFHSTGDQTTVRDCEFVDNKDGTSIVLHLAQQSTVENCLFLRNAGFVGGIFMEGSDETTIRFNTFAYDSASSAGGGLGVANDLGQTGDVSSNIFYSCHADVGAVGAAVILQINGTLAFNNNVVAASTGETVLFSSGNFHPQDGCNVIWDNETLDLDDWALARDDILLDPEFCDPTGLDFTVKTSSPCLGENNGGCGLIGRFGRGCGSVSVGPISWGRLKAFFGNRGRER